MVVVMTQNTQVKAKPRTIVLEKTVYTTADLIPPDALQIALAGRSNVGKSSLLNRLAGRKQLAKTSATPGKTQSINFYRVEPGGAFLADLPGYGYARRSKEERARWAAMIERYLTRTEQLAAVAVLIDSRLPPQESDLDMVAWLKASDIPVIGVLTKADKCSQRERQTQKSRWAGLLGGQPPVLFSSVTGLGLEELWARFDSIIGPPASVDTQDEGGPDS
jgi:GTP-binding protein